MSQSRNNKSSQEKLQIANQEKMAVNHEQMRGKQEKMWAELLAGQEQIKAELESS